MSEIVVEDLIIRHSIGKKKKKALIIEFGGFHCMSPFRNMLTKKYRGKKNMLPMLQKCTVVNPVVNKACIKLVLKV